MIVQVNIEKHVRPSRFAAFGFYRIMLLPREDELPSYWMFNGVWHTRRPPNLNPPRPWPL